MLRNPKQRSSRFIGPEILGVCPTCGLFKCLGCDHKEGDNDKTMETDVYAFGCLYYAVRFLTYTDSDRFITFIDIL